MAEDSVLEMFCIEDEGIMIRRNVGNYYQSTRHNISDFLNFLLVLLDRNAFGQIVSESLTSTYVSQLLHVSPIERNDLYKMGRLWEGWGGEGGACPWGIPRLWREGWSPYNDQKQFWNWVCNFYDSIIFISGTRVFMYRSEFDLMHFISDRSCLATFEIYLSNLK